MRHREIGADDTLASGNLRGAAVKTQTRPSARLPDDFDLEPVDSEADAGPERLGGGFFGGKTGGKTLGGVAFSQAIGLFLSEVNAIEKTPPKAIHGVLDARDLDQVDSGAGNHVLFHATTKGLMMCRQRSYEALAEGLRARALRPRPITLAGRPDVWNRSSCSKGGQAAFNSATALIPFSPSPIKGM